MDIIFREHSKKIWVYIGKETETDPIEHTVEVTLQNPIPIKAIVTDLTPTKTQYAMPGIVTDKSKEIIIKKKYKALLEMSQKISIDGDYYEGWRKNGTLQYRIEGNYLRAYIYTKKV